MSFNTQIAPDVQPIAAHFKGVILRCIKNESNPSDKKDMLMTAYQDGWICECEIAALINAWGLVSA